MRELEIVSDAEGRDRWLAAPVDLHYRGQIAEIGVRATDAMEHELIAANQRRIAESAASDEDERYPLPAHERRVDELMAVGLDWKAAERKADDEEDAAYPPTAWQYDVVTWAAERGQVLSPAEQETLFAGVDAFSDMRLVGERIGEIIARRPAGRPRNPECAFRKCRRVVKPGQMVVRVHPGELGSSYSGPASAWGFIHAEHVSDANMKIAARKGRVTRFTAQDRWAH